MSRTKTKKTDPPAWRLDYLSILPGSLLCVMCFLMLVMDLALPGMLQEQYVNFPALFRMVHFAAVGAGLLFWCFYLRENGAGLLHPQRLVRPDTLFILFFILFALWILVSTAVNGLDEKALHGVSYRNIGIFHLLAFLLVYLFLSAQIRRESFRRGLLSVFLLSADLLALAALTDRFFLAIPAFAQKKEVSTIFFNGNHYGYFLTMAVLAAAGFFLYQSGGRERILGLVSLLLNFVVLLLNHSLGCLLAVGAVLLLLLAVTLCTNRSAAQRLGLLFAAIALLLLLGLVLVPALRGEFTGLLSDLQQISGGENAGSAGHNRWMLWSLTCDLISSRPVFGYGCEGISDTLMDAVGRANPHCEILTYAAFYGIPAAVFYVLALVFVFIFWIRSRIWTDPASMSAALAAAGYFISSLFGVPMFYTAPFFFIMLGLSLHQDDPSPRKPVRKEGRKKERHT